MSTISLGFDPLPLEVRLAPDSDFVTAIVAEGGWPPGAQLELQVRLRGANPVVWAATLDGEAMTWNVPAAQVAAVLAARPTQVRLHYREGADGPTLLWASGPVDSR
ncbi:hypothetical protein [Pseudonocardia sp. WMMC193]|uniref:LtfC-like domain-containing protein n=1 Tax=Pseudonocardia sp. WMMC193 TaxID=2911965 RepID=UPI001F3A2133|nr:hypothetical protein [Pseudonocardia sp. WMMC193]MCF7547616.1 hypothetical protein [Pseudonocardia sp. WMMC193]